MSPNNQRVTRFWQRCGEEQVGIGLEEGDLAGADGLDQIAQGGPAFGGSGKWAEVEQGDLADGVAGADAADEAAGGVGFGAVAGAGMDAANEHGAPSMARVQANMQATTANRTILCHYKGRSNCNIM